MATNAPSAEEMVTRDVKSCDVDGGVCGRLTIRIALPMAPGSPPDNSRTSFAQGFENKSAVRYMIPKAPQPPCIERVTTQTRILGVH